MMEKRLSTLTKMFELHELAHDSTYIFPYALVKEAVFQFYLWGYHSDNDDVIELYIQLLALFRTYDAKFVKPEVIESRRGKAGQES